MKNRKTALIYAVGLAYAVISASPALSATLKKAAILSDDTLTVGDVFDGADSYADRYLAPAPAPGKVMHLTAHDLNRIARAFNLDWSPSTGIESLSVTRPVSTVARNEIEKAVYDALMDKMPGQKIELSLSGAPIALQLPVGTDTSVAVNDLSLNMQKGTFTARIAVPATNPSVRQNVRGRVYTLVDVPVLANPLRNEDIISARDITTIEIRAEDIANNILVDAESIIGQTPRRFLSAMKPMTDSDLVTPLSVKKGDIVTILMQSGPLNLTLQGRALQNGAEGEVVRIVNTESNRTIEGLITGPQTITMNLPSSKL